MFKDSPKILSLVAVIALALIVAPASFGQAIDGNLVGTVVGSDRRHRAKRNSGTGKYRHRHQVYDDDRYLTDCTGSIMCRLGRMR